MKPELELLINARKLIENPECWTQGVFACDEDGFVTDIEEGVCFCSMGAIIRADGGLGNESYIAAFGAMQSVIGNSTSISRFNDTHTHAEVLAMFDKAIERLSK